MRSNSHMPCNGRANQQELRISQRIFKKKVLNSFKLVETLHRLNEQWKIPNQKSEQQCDECDATTRGDVMFMQIRVTQ